jgi:hypothetical protein
VLGATIDRRAGFAGKMRLKIQEENLPGWDAGTPRRQNARSKDRALNFESHRKDGS